MEILYEHPKVVVGWRDPVFVAWWRTTPDLATATEMTEHFMRIGRASPTGIIFIVIASVEVGAPDRTASDRLGKSTRAIEKHILAHAFIIEGKGFKAGAVRATVKALQSLTRVIFPWTIAATTEEGLLWVARKAKFLSEEEAEFMIADIKAMQAARL